MTFESRALRHPVSRGCPGLRRALFAAALLLAGCNTTPERPPPAPAPIPDSVPLPAPPPLPPLQPEGPIPDQARGGEPPAPGSPASYPAPSSDAADVEIEEVPVGETNATEMRPHSEVLAEMSDSNKGNGGGGAAVPAGGNSGEGAETSGATGQALPAGDAGGAGTMGPDIQIGAPAGAPTSKALDDKLALFEEHLRRARAAAEQEHGAAAATGSPQGQVDGRGQRVDEAPDGAGGAATTGSGLGNTPDFVGETTGAAQPSPVAAGTPPDLTDATNDDIVARQLREAASREPDPVLREKLWLEYRHYKAGL